MTIGCPLRIVFFGTPRFAAEMLAYLLQHEIVIVAIVTQPDRPQGRSLQLTASPVKKEAERLVPHVPVLQPEQAKDPQWIAELALFQADLFVVVAFGQILSQPLLDLPRLGCINVHASRLPRYRGAAPMQRALMEGASSTGVTIMRMVRQMDAGDQIAWAEIPISSQCTHGELETGLCRLAEPLLLSVLHAYRVEIPAATPQDPLSVTYAPKISALETRINWNLPAQEIHNLIRALSPEPGAWCWALHRGEQKRIKLFRSRVVPLHVGGAPGSFVHADLQGMVVQCGEGALELLEVQQEGKKKILFADWFRGVGGVSLL